MADCMGEARCDADGSRARKAQQYQEDTGIRGNVDMSEEEADQSDEIGGIMFMTKDNKEWEAIPNHGRLGSGGHGWTQDIGEGHTIVGDRGLGERAVLSGGKQHQDRHPWEEGVEGMRPGGVPDSN